MQLWSTWDLYGIFYTRGGVSTTPLVQDILQVPQGSNACCSFYCNVVEVIICNFEHLGPLWNILHKGSIDISEVLSLPHMFWSALISTELQRLSADQNHAYTFSSHFGWKATWKWPTQHHSALNHWKLWSELISAAQSVQWWSVHSMLDHWMLIRTEWHWTELDFTCCYYINNKKKCRSKDWTIAFTYITWPTLTILPLSHTVFIRHRTIILYMSFLCAPSQTSLGKHRCLIWCQTTLNPFLFLHHHHPPQCPHSAASPPRLLPPPPTTVTDHPQPTPHPCQWRRQHLATPRHSP